MPRPKGSKNKPKVVSAPTNLDEQIKVVTAEIAVGVPDTMNFS